MFDFSKGTALLVTAGGWIVKHRAGIAKMIGITAMVGSSASAIRKIPDVVKEIDDEVNKRNEEPKSLDKMAISGRHLWKEAIIFTSGVGLTVYSDVSLHVQYKTHVENLVQENKSLLTQVTETAIAYNAVASAKNAITERLPEKYSPAKLLGLSSNGEDVVNKDEEEALTNLSFENGKPILVNNSTGEILNAPAIAGVYVCNPKKIEEMNQRFLQTGDPRWRPQIFKFYDTGADFISCLHIVNNGFEEFNREKDNPNSEGYGVLSWLCEKIWAPYGEITTRLAFKSGTKVTPEYETIMDDDGVAKILIRLSDEPLYSYNGRFDFIY